VHTILHDESKSNFIYIAMCIQKSVYIHRLLYRNYYISYLFAGLIQLQLIALVQCVNNATSHNNNPHTIHTY